MSTFAHKITYCIPEETKTIVPPDPACRQDCVPYVLIMSTFTHKISYCPPEETKT